jgi:predicted porin
MINRTMCWTGYVALGVLSVVPCVAMGQVALKTRDLNLTLEAWANVAGAFGTSSERQDASPVQADGAVRLLALLKLRGFGRFGGRIVGEALAGVDDDARFGERSVLWTGALGRLEYGRRMGLPDVLTGYAPNPFQFTSAEFGPASGFSLDPGGGITSRFAPDAIRDDLDSLAVLGFGTSLFADQSQKLLFVSPKRGGFLAGVSYASSVSGSEARNLLQTGLVHETYWHENEFRVGGAYTHVESARGEGLDSIYAGASFALENEWYFGVAATLNPTTSGAAVDGWRGDAFGVTGSINYNHGPWTAGGFLQQARGRASRSAEEARLSAAEAGISYRTSTKLRLFAAVYHYRFDPPDGASRRNDTQFILGARITL